MSIIISYHGDSLYLPNPEYSNSESNLDKINIQRSMFGDVFTVIRKRKIETFKIKLLLERVHLRQLQTFLLSYSDKPLNYTDHHGDLWVGYFYDETIDSTENQTWLNEINLIFEGYKLI